MNNIDRAIVGIKKLVYGIVYCVSVFLLIIVIICFHNDIVWELFKVFLTAGLSVIGITYGINYGKKKERERENEKLKLKLFNYNEHAKAIIRGSEKVIAVFTKFSEEILASPLEEHAVKDVIKIPDLYRIDEMDKDDIFSAFILFYEIKLDGADAYREASNAIEFFKNVFETLYSKYFSISEDIYKEKQVLVNDIFLTKTLVTDISLTLKYDNENYLDLDSYKDINEFLIEYNKKEKRAIAEKKLSLQFYIDDLLLPLRDILEKYLNDRKVRELFIHIAKIMAHKDRIEHSSKELGTLLGDNVKTIPEWMEKLSAISIILNVALEEYYAGRVKDKRIHE